MPGQRGIDAGAGAVVHVGRFIARVGRIAPQRLILAVDHCIGRVQHAGERFRLVKKEPGPAQSRLQVAYRVRGAGFHHVMARIRPAEQAAGVLPRGRGRVLVQVGRLYRQPDLRHGIEGRAAEILSASGFVLAVDGNAHGRDHGHGSQVIRRGAGESGGERLIHGIRSGRGRPGHRRNIVKDKGAGG